MLKYIHSAQEYLIDSNINLDLILNNIIENAELNDNEKLALCSFVKTLIYSQSYWANNDWKSIQAQVPSFKKSAKSEAIVLADCCYLWYGTLTGGPVVGVGAGVLASAVASLN